MTSVDFFTICPESIIAPTLEPASEVIDPKEPQHWRILIVDDDPANSQRLKSLLEEAGYQLIHSAVSGRQAIAQAASTRPDLVLLNVHLVDSGGIEFLNSLHVSMQPSPPPVIALAEDLCDPACREVLEQGATDVLQLPVRALELTTRVRCALTLKASQDRLSRYSDDLEEAVRRRTSELEVSRLDAIHCLARAAEFRDDDTGQHIIRVGRYARIIGHQLGMSEAQLDILEPAAQLHDVGKIGIPDAVLLKPGRLTPEEYEVIQKHCGYGKKIVDCLPPREAELVRGHAELGAQIVDVGRSPILKVAKRIALTHHERWDGTGYPLGLSGEDIPLEGRITAVADVFDALSSKRIYKPAFPLEKCFRILDEGRGTQFDPRVLDAFFARRDDIVQCQIELADTE